MLALALGDSYASLSELRLRVGLAASDPTTDDARLTSALSVASRGIEKLTHRQFNTAASGTARVFYPNTFWRAEVDDFSAVASIKTDLGDDGTYETTWDAADYQLEPLNGVVDGESGWPYWTIRAVGSKTFPCVDAMSRAPLEVTATWGWSAVPSPIKEACLVLAEEIFKLADTPFGSGGQGQFGIIRARENPFVWVRIKPYVRDLIMVG